MKGVTGENLLLMLERRLDNAVYRLGLASSRAAARQLVRHGHIQVAGRKVNIPSFAVVPGQEIAVRGSEPQIWRRCSARWIFPAAGAFRPGCNWTAKA